jgi:hypothetical protein
MRVTSSSGHWRVRAEWWGWLTGLAVVFLAPWYWSGLVVFVALWRVADHRHALDAERSSN